MGSRRDCATCLSGRAPKPDPARHGHHADQLASARDDRDDSANDGRNQQRSLHPGPWHERSASCRRAAGSVIQSAANETQETVEIIKLAFAGERIEYHGKNHEMPLPGGQGKALRFSQPGNSNIPIYLATLRPHALEYTGAVADGWLGTSFTPEHAAAHLDYLRRGAEAAGRSLADVEIEAGGPVAFVNDLDALVEPLKPAMAFTLGAMGSAPTNFYNDAFKRGGWEAVGREVQRLWVAGERSEAIAKVPSELVIQANLLGSN